MHKTYFYNALLMVSLCCCYALKYTKFTEEEKQSMSDVNKIPRDIAIRLWENYNYNSDLYYPIKENDNMIHMGYKYLLHQWNQSIYEFYEKYHFLPRVPDYRKQPHYLMTKYYDPKKTFYENHDFFLTKDFFYRPESRNAADVLLIKDLSEVFWTAVLLERRAMFYTFYNASEELRKKKQIYSFIKRMTILYYPAHREADRYFDRYDKPRITDLPDITPPSHDVFLPANDFFDMYEFNYTNICPITDNYICNTFVPLHESEGAPCYCALIEPFDTDPRYEWDDGCVRRTEFIDNVQYISITISSLIPNELVPSNAYGLLFAELITVALVNATILPGAFQPKFLHVNPTVIFRLHCSALMQEFTIQFGVFTKKFTTADDNAYETDYLFLSPKRFWEEVEDQNTLQYLDDMGLRIIRYGIVDNLTDINEPNMESPYQYPRDHESDEICPLPNTKSKFDIFHYVVLENNCSHLYLSFWKSLLLTWFLTFTFLCLLISGFATYFKRYRWIISFGRFKRALQTEYID